MRTLKTASQVTCSALLLSLLSAPLVALEPHQQAKMIHDCAQPEGLNLEGSAAIVPEGPRGESILRADGKFSGRVDLKALKLDPRDYDLLKFEVMTPRGAFLRFSLENYPQEGELSHWYVFDGTRGPSKWKTVWVDLKLIEEVKLPGKYKGLAARDPSLRGLQILGQIIDSRRSIQEPGSSMWIRNIRFVKKAVDLDWDQITFEKSWEKGRDLVYRYPVTVHNLLAKPATVNLSLHSVDAVEASAEFSESTLKLKAGEKTTVTATVRLPASVAANAKPLDCQRFEARATVEEYDNSEVTILRSADPIHLNVTVPLPKSKLALPFYPPLKKLPPSVFEGWDEKAAREHAAAISPEKARKVVEQAVLKFQQPEGGVLHSAVASAGILYGLTGEKQYFESLRAVFLAYADVYSRLAQEDRKKKYRLVSDGLMAGNVLQFCFKYGGGQRPPYYYSLGGNGAYGSLFGHMHALDAIAGDLSQEDRQKIINKLILPMMIQVRNHYFGLGNQQSNSNNVVLYSALLSEHWPTAGFAFSSEHGLLGNIKWTFDDDGLCREGHYQEYTINPILHTTEALYGRGIDLYDQRMYDIVHSRGADAIGQGYRYGFASFLDQHRFAGKPFMTKQASTAQDGYHLNASTLLKWKELEVAMNWGTHIFRGSHDRSALSIRTPRKGTDRELRRLTAGGGAYNHSTFGQSAIIVNEGLQNSVPGKVISYDVQGPVQHVTAVSEDHYPGSKISRTFVLLDRSVLVIDRVACDKPSTVDWYLASAGGKLSVPVEQRKGSWTTKAYDNRVGAKFGGEVAEHTFAKTSDSWTEGGGRLTMLGAPNTEIFTWKGVPRQQLMVRRSKVKSTQFMAFFSLEPASLESGPVKIKSGSPTDATGVTVKLDSGKTFHVLINDTGARASYAGLSSDQHFATDFK